MKNIFITLLIYPLIVISQDKFEPGAIDQFYVEMKACPYDSSAKAFYILDYGKTKVTSGLDVSFEHRVQLKILDKTEFDRADITIPYGKTGVKRLKAFTYNMVDGQLVTTKLEKNDIYKEKITSDNGEIKFSMPNIREGSVIEYSYTVEYGNVRNLNTWYFQTSIPVLKSEYEVLFPDYFNYYRYMTGYLGLDKADVTKPRNSNNIHHHYIASNIPSYESEKYIRSRDYTISKIGFKLQSAYIPGVFLENYLYDSYRELSNKQVKDHYWSKDIERAPWAKDVLERLKSDDKITYATNVFNFIKSFDKSSESITSLKNCFKEKRGTDRDKTRLLIALLREAGFHADPVLIRTRSLGPLDLQFPMRSHFNFAIVNLKIDEDEYLLDPTEKDHLFGVLPGYCINGQGLVIKEGDEQWVELKPYKINAETITADLSLSEDGVLNGKVIILKKGYRAWNFKGRLRKIGEKEHIESFAKQQENWLIEDHDISNNDDYVIKEEVEVEIENQTEDIGDIIYLNPFVFSIWEDHPFKSSNRIYPIDFGVPFAENTTSQIKIPDNLIIDTLPETTAISLPNNAGVFTYTASKMDNTILISQRMFLKRSEFLPTDYQLLREFFTQIIEKAGEQIVLKRT